MRVAHALLLSFPVVALSVLAPACLREGQPVVAPVELVDIGDAGPSPALAVIVPSAPRGGCSARLRASPIATKDGCTLDERISKGDGILHFPCSGTGELEAVFGEHRFRGTVAGDELHLVLKTELDWDDGCHWETEQAIRGSWRPDGGAAKLVWTYKEHPVRGTSCFGSCTARAVIELDEVTH